jgi:hypothetical protein
MDLLATSFGPDKWKPDALRLDPQILTLDSMTLVQLS